MKDFKDLTEEIESILNATGGGTIDEAVATGVTELYTQRLKDIGKIKSMSYGSDEWIQAITQLLKDFRRGWSDLDKNDKKNVMVLEKALEKFTDAFNPVHDALDDIRRELMGK